MPELKLIVEYYSGEISEREIISLKEKVLEDSLFDISFNLITDFSDVTFRLSDEGITTLYTWLQKRNASQRKSALITETPDQVARILVFNNKHSQKLPMMINVFSTLSAAVKWVDLPAETEAEIRQTLDELINSPD